MSLVSKDFSLEKQAFPSIADYLAKIQGQRPLFCFPLPAETCSLVTRYWQEMTSSFLKGKNFSV